mmetsp:Transcript_20071/g.30053  ORF Transcript_20071/g.30053 Transcript_20071/m.30053 type:complete len:943 (-) Transcript_20071:48-2876(-)
MESKSSLHKISRSNAETFWSKNVTKAIVSTIDEMEQLYSNPVPGSTIDSTMQTLKICREVAQDSKTEAAPTERILYILMEDLSKLKDRMSRYKNTSPLFRWLRFNLRKEVRSLHENVESHLKDIERIVKMQKDTYGWASFFRTDLIRDFWIGMDGEMGVKLDVLVQHLLKATERKESKSFIGQLEIFFDPDGDKTVDVHEFRDAVKDIELDEKLNSSLKSMLNALLNKIEERVYAIMARPKPNHVKGSGFAEIAESKKGVEALFEKKDKGFTFNFTEKGKTYTDHKKESEAKINTKIVFRRTKSGSSKEYIKTRFIDKTCIKWGLNFSGKVEVKITKLRCPTEVFYIYIPGQKTYDPAGRTGDPHASEAIGASCTRFQGAVTSAQIFAAINGATSTDIQKIQEDARHVLNNYHGRGALFEWMQHQIQAVFVDHHRPLNYPVFIRAYFVEMGKIDLEDPRHAHTKKYLRSYEEGLPYPPIEYFAKLQSKYQTCGELPPQPKFEVNWNPENYEKEKFSFNNTGTVEAEAVNVAIVVDKKSKPSEGETEQSPYFQGYSETYETIENLGSTERNEQLKKLFLSRGVDKKAVDKLEEKGMLSLQTLQELDAKGISEKGDIVLDSAKTIVEVLESLPKKINDKTKLADVQGHKKRQEKLKIHELLVDESKVKVESAVIGEGNFGNVHLCTLDGKEGYAIKIPKHHGITENDWREMNLNCKLPPHNNLLKLSAVVLMDEKMCLVSPLCEKGSLEKLHGQNLTEEKTFLGIVKDLFSAVHHLHQSDPCIVHGDIRCANILMNSDGKCILSDWGLSHCLDCPQSIHRMTKGTQHPWPWTAPEVLLERKSSTASDIYMVGVTLWEIATKGKDPYDYRNLALDISTIGFAKEVAAKKRELEFPKNHPNGPIYEIAQLCLDPDPLERVNILQMRATIDLHQKRMAPGDCCCTLS